MKRREVRVLLSPAPWCCINVQLEGDDVAALIAKIYQQIESQPEQRAALKAVSELLLRNNGEAMRGDAAGPARRRTSRLTNGLVRLLTWSF
jgi:hypothetical protein